MRDPAFWTPEKVAVLQEVHANHVPYMFCTAGEVSQTNNNNNIKTISNIIEELRPVSFHII